MTRNNNKKIVTVKHPVRFGNKRLVMVKFLFVSILFGFLFLSLFSISSCDIQESDNNGAEKVENTTELSEEMCSNFAVKIHTALVDQDTNFIESYINWSELKAKLDGGSTISTETWESVRKEIKVGESIISEIESGSHIRFITYYEKEEEHHVVMRIFSEPQTINFLDFEISGNSNSLAIVDIYDYDQGMLLSEWMQGNLLFELAHPNELKTIQNKVLSFYQEDSLAVAYKYLENTSLEFKKTPAYFKMQELIFLGSDSPTLIIDLLSKRMERIGIGEKGRWLSVYYYNGILGKYADAQLALTNIENEVGEDAMLTYLQGNLHLERGEYEKAYEKINKALSLEPEIMSIHFAKVLTCVLQKNYVQATESLLVMDDYFEISEVDWDAEFDQYPEFLKSEEYKKWKNRKVN